MNISAVNCTPIKPQTSFGTSQCTYDATKVLQLSKKLEDSFKTQQANIEDPSCIDETITPKGHIQTAVSVLGACAAMFALGKGAGKGLVALAKKVPASAKENILNTGKKAATAISEQAAKLPKNEKVSTILSNTVGKAFNAAKAHVIKNPEKSFTTAAGVLAATTLVPSIATADGNNDGIADIAQNNINAYESVFQKAEIFADIINALS